MAAPSVAVDGRRILTLRQESGLSRRELAKLSCISYSHMANIEKGHSRPAVELLARIARILGVPLADVLPERRAS